MKTTKILLHTGVLALSLLATQVMAAISADEAAKLGTSLTPLGGGEGRQRRRQHPRLGRRPGDQRRQRRQPWLPRQPLCQRATAVHHHRAERRPVQGQADSRPTGHVQALPGYLQDPGIQDPPQRHRPGGGAGGGQAQRHHHQAGGRRQRPGELRYRQPVPDPAERPGGDLEPHHPLSRRQRPAPGDPGHSAGQRLLPTGLLPGCLHLPYQPEGLQPEQAEQRAVLLQAAGHRALAPGR